MGINKKKLLKTVMIFMESKMNQLGFEKSISNQCFFKDKDSDFRLSYSLVYMEKFNMKSREVGIVIEPHIGVYNIPIEKIFLRITTRIGVKLFDLKSIGNSVANIIANPSGEYKSRNNNLDIFSYKEDDAETTANILLNYFENVALPYYQEFANWQSLDNIFNNTLSHSKWSLHCLIEPERDMRGLILAKLINRIDLDYLIKIHSERLLDIDSENRHIEFERVLSILPELEPIITPNWRMNVGV